MQRAVWGMLGVRAEQQRWGRGSAEAAGVSSVLPLLEQPATGNSRSFSSRSSYLPPSGCRAHSHRPSSSSDFFSSSTVVGKFFTIPLTPPPTPFSQHIFWDGYPYVKFPELANVFLNLPDVIGALLSCWGVTQTQENCPHTPPSHLGVPNSHPFHKHLSPHRSPYIRGGRCSFLDAHCPKPWASLGMKFSGVKKTETEVEKLPSVNVLESVSWGHLQQWCCNHDF